MKLDTGYPPGLQWLADLQRFGVRLGLERMGRLLVRLGHPQRGWGGFHVAGTNGKGSTAAALASILRAAGIRTGLYTSPHLERFGERVQVDGTPLGDWHLARAGQAVRPAMEAVRTDLGEPPTQFEVETALAWVALREAGVDTVVNEVGLGGRHDATNLVSPPWVSVIASLGLDHVQHLGRTLTEIAREKAGIIKPGVPVVAVARPGLEYRMALAEIAQAAFDVDAPLYWVVPATPEALTGPQGDRWDEAEMEQTRLFLADTGMPVEWEDVSVGPAGGSFYLQTPWGRLEGLQTALLGRHQLENAALAATAALVAAASAEAPVRPARAELLARLDAAAVRAGLAQACWPGRFEVLRRDPLVVVDGAHNPAGALALARCWKELFPERRPILVLAVLADKQVGDMLPALADLAGAAIVTQVDHPRALPASELAQQWRALAPHLPAQVQPDLDAALRQAAEQAQAQAQGAVLVAGSLFLAGPARRRYNGPTCGKN